MQHTSEQVRQFFSRSDFLDRMVLRPLSHIAANWEISWGDEVDLYELEKDSFAADLNWLIKQIAESPRPARYHTHEDAIVKMLKTSEWPAQTLHGRWITADYPHLLEQGAFHDLNQQNLITAAAGRVHAALDRGQSHFDQMEIGHLVMLAAIMTIAIYHRDCDGSSFLHAEREGET